MSRVARRAGYARCRAAAQTAAIWPANVRSGRTSPTAAASAAPWAAPASAPSWC